MLADFFSPILWAVDLLTNSYYYECVWVSVHACGCAMAHLWSQSSFYFTWILKTELGVSSLGSSTQALTELSCRPCEKLWDCESPVGQFLWLVPVLLEFFSESPCLCLSLLYFFFIALWFILSLLLILVGLSFIILLISQHHLSKRLFLLKQTTPLSKLKGL